MKNCTYKIHCRYFCLFLFSICFLLPSGSFADDVLSHAVVVMDASTGELLYAKNPHIRRLPASTTKLMTAIIAVENANLSDLATISRNTAHTPPHKAGLKKGDQVSVEKLLYAALLGSANDAAVALSEIVAGDETSFVTLMNRKALEIGAENTRFINSNGLPGPGQYTTAYDLAKIMSYALRYQKLKEIIGTRVTDIMTENGKSIFLRNTNRLLWSGEDLLGGKTGYTRKARHCFVCAAERENHTVIVAILGSPSRESLWRESETLISKGFEVLGKNGQRFVYVTETDSDTADISKETHVKNRQFKAKVSQSGKGRKFIAQKTTKQKKIKIYAKKKSKSNLLVKKKGKTYAKGKQNGKKNFNIAEKSGIDRNKG